MATLTEIWNLALIELKSAKTITDPDLPGTTENTFRAKYASVRDAVLRAHPWNCAIRRFSLPAAAAVPSFGFAHAYNLPTDPWCLRVLEVGDPASQLGTPWVVEGRQLLTDLGAPVVGRYIARVSEGIFDANLVTAIAKRLGSECSGSLGNSTVRKKELWDEYEDLLREARSIDGMESGPEEEEISSIEQARLI